MKSLRRSLSDSRFVHRDSRESAMAPARKRPAAAAAAPPAKRRLRGKRPAPAWDDGLPAEFRAWRGGVVYTAYAQLGGRRRWAEVCLELLAATPSPADYARAAGAYIDDLLAAEGHSPVPGGPLLLQEWAALTIVAWREEKLLAAAAPASEKRPAASRNRCRGRLREPCRFSSDESGARARYQDASQQCPWCNCRLLAKAMASVGGQRKLARALAFVWRNDKEIFRAACARLPQRAPVHFPLRALGLPPAFHSAEAILVATSTPQGRGRCVAGLKKRTAADPEAVQEALPAIPAEHRAAIEAKIRAEPRRARQARARADAAAAEAAVWALRQRATGCRGHGDLQGPGPGSSQVLPCTGEAGEA